MQFKLGRAIFCKRHNARIGDDNRIGTGIAYLFDQRFKIAKILVARKRVAGNIHAPAH
ncbi:hypothetical protein SDC9_195369 [bioreactor metagenome]|uniref:Uncharacterized protein n=1 Tax=bioreactor metagenome TaxID=1076179 RepID=A0A645I8V3_9ZZZZ